MKHFLTLFFTALLAMTASGAANVGVGSLPVLSSFTNGQYLVIATGNSSNSPLRLVPFSAVSNGWLSVQKFTDGLLAPSSNLTNYTVTATVAERTINATNNIHFSSVSGGSSGQKMFPSFTVTNFSGADRLLTFASGWTAYGSPTNTISSGKTARVMFEVEGSNVRYGVVVEGESSGGSGSSGGMVPVSWTDNSSSNPLDSTVYLLGILGGGMTTSGNWDYVRRYCPKTGTINLVEVRVRTSGTLGSSENVTFVVRKNDTTDSSSWTGTFDAVAKVIRVTNLNFSVTAGDEIAIKLTAPAWATNPTTVRTDATLYVE